MFLGMQGELIALTANTKDELENASMKFTEIVETDDVYTIVDGAYLTEESALIKAKKKKYEENTVKAKYAVENGYVIFKDAQFETNTQTVGDLTATMLMLQNERAEAERLAVSKTETPFNASEVNNIDIEQNLTYTWLSKDDKTIELTLEDFITLGNSISAFKNTIWSSKYLEFKTEIENAQTIEELNEIEINYGNFDV